MPAVNDPVRVYTDVDSEVLEHGDSLRTDPRSRTMQVLNLLRWTVRDTGTEMIRIIASVDTQWCYGLCCGYAAVYSFTGE